MENVYRPSRVRNGVSIRAKKYKGRFTVLDNPRVYDVPLYASDKQVARQKLRAMVLEKEREAVGNCTEAAAGCRGTAAPGSPGRVCCRLECKVPHMGVHSKD